jgi:WD40 repeat protein
VRPLPDGRGSDFASLEFRQLLGRFVDVCNAVAYAHSRGILHRDLKPGNIMLGKFGETLVVDWGLAKAGITLAEPGASTTEAIPPDSLLRPRSVSGSSATLAGSALGTPPYMSPEQAAGRLAELGAASDVYSLGATLYQLLTGTAPFSGDAAEVLKKVQAGDFTPPRKLNAAIPAALEAVCLRAMALTAADRYPSVHELSDDLERWLADDPVRAWTEPWTVKARRWTNRHRVLVTSAAACLVVATVALVGGLVLMAHANADLEAANQTIRSREADTQQAYRDLESANAKIVIANQNLHKANQDEQEARKHAEDLLATSTMMLARSRFEQGQAGVADELLAQVPSRSRHAPWRLLKHLAEGSLFTLRGHTRAVTSVAFAPDGRLLASASADNTVKLWETGTGHELRTLHGHTWQVMSVAFDADGQRLASASFDGTVRLWDVRTGRELRTLCRHPESVSSVAFAADGRSVAAGLGATVKVWSALTGEAMRTLHGHGSSVGSVAFAPDGRTLASASFDGTVVLWDARTGRELHTIPGRFGRFGTEHTTVTFSADGRVLAAGKDQSIKLWDVLTGRELRTLGEHRLNVASVAFTPDGQYVASASEDATVKLWNAWTGQEVRTLCGHANHVLSVACAPGGQLLASGDAAGTVKLWKTSAELRALRGHRDQVMSVAFAADGKVLASASGDKTIKLWDVQTGREVRTIRGHQGPVMCVACSADGRMLASAGDDRTVKLWDPRTGQQLHDLRGHSQRVDRVAFIADGQVLASASMDDTIKLWDTRTGQQIRTLGDPKEVVRSVVGTVHGIACSADGRVLASGGSSERLIKLWDPQTGQALRTLHGHTHWVNAVALAADGSLLASASWDRTIRLWDVRTGQELHRLPGHGSWVPCLAFTADAMLLAAANEDGTVNLWDTRTGQELCTLRTGTVRGLSFAPDSRVLATAGTDHHVRFWDVRADAPLRTLSGHADRVTGVAYSVAGSMLASASVDGTVKLWDARTGTALRTLRGHTAKVSTVAFAPNGWILASGDWFGDHTVRLWNARSGEALHTLRGHTASIATLAFASDGKVLASGAQDATVRLWDVRSGESLGVFRLGGSFPAALAFGPDGKTIYSRDVRGRVLQCDLATGTASVEDPPSGFEWPIPDATWIAEQNSLALGHGKSILLVPKVVAESERRFRLWVTAPDWQLHRILAEQAETANQPLALAFRLGRCLAAQNEDTMKPHRTARVVGWLGTGPDRLRLMAGAPDLVATPLHAPAFPNGIACTGVLYKDSGIAPARLLIDTARALEGDPLSWLNHAFHGGALYRNGDYAQAQAALTQAAHLHGKPGPLTHHLLALTSAALGQKDKARQYRGAAVPAIDAPWEDHMLHGLLLPEVDAALGKANVK